MVIPGCAISYEFVAFILPERCLSSKEQFYWPSIIQVVFSYWIIIILSWFKYQRLWRVPLGLYVIINSLYLDDLMSVDRASGEWRVVGLLLTVGGGGGLCIYVCKFFSYGR